MAASSIPVTSLQHDLSSIQSAITSMLSKMNYSPIVPSWRYPEKMAVAVELEGLIASSRKEEERRLLVTELIVDRLLLLLQLAIQLINARGSRHRSAVPLTLSSAVRKFSKYVLAQQEKEVTCGGTVSMNQCHEALHTDSSRRDVSVQTIETALAVCSQCDDYHQALLEINTRVKESASTISQPVTTTKILRSILNELDMIEADRKNTQTHLRARIAEQDSHLEELRNESSALHSNITALEQELSIMKERCELAITARDNNHSGEMERVMSALQGEREEAVSLRKDVLRARVETDRIKQEQERKRIEGITAERKTMEAKLRAVQSQLEEELASERDTNQRLIEQNNIQLNKAKLLSSSLDKRCKYLQTKQASLLLHVDQLDERCNLLQHELSLALSDKEGLMRDLADMKAQLQQHENTHKVLLEEANGKHSELTMHCSNLEEQLELTRSLLEEERAMRMLMVECPLVADLGQQLSSKQSAQQYVFANIARIHTIEELNGELRKQLLPVAHDRSQEAAHDGSQQVAHDGSQQVAHDGSQQVAHDGSQQAAHDGSQQVAHDGSQQVLQHPVKLWQDLVYPLRPISYRMRSYRGKLGHLVDALCHSQQQQAWTSDGQHNQECCAGTQPLAWSTVTMCSLCDKTLCFDQERLLHEQYCTLGEIK